MENLKRRGLSLLLALMMIVSLFAGVQLPEASAASYVYNWGTRGVIADELSSMAEDWWSTKPAYSTLAAMDGSSDLNTISNSALYSTLASIMENAHTTKTTYDGTRELYQYTDCQNGGGKISAFYSGKDVGPEWDSGSTWNREHTWPNSKGLGGKDEEDIMMLRPADSTTNSSRGNKAYGESSGYFNPNSVSDGAYDLRGDVSRIFLYSYVRWGIVDGNGEYDTWGSDGVMESVAVLLDWMEEDPVDTWELGRNDAVQSITGTRNVFVDYPELAFLLFEESVPTDYTTPSGGSNTPTSSYAVTLKENGVTVDTLTGSSVELPTATTPEGYTFVGWVEAEVDKVESKPTVYAAGASYLPSKDTTLYALYSYSETTGGGTGSESTTVSTTIADIASSNGWVDSKQNLSFTMGDDITVTATGKTNTGKYYTNGNNWRIYQNENPSVIISAGDKTISTVKITYTPSNTGVLTHNGSNVSSGITVEVNDTSVTFSVGNTGSATNGQVRITAIEVVLAGSGGGTTTTYYTTTTCAHADTENVAAEAATCTADGYTAGVYCNDCETYISGHEVIKAEGHNYEAVVTAPTATEQGYTTYTCTSCDDSYVDNYVPALGEDFTVSFVVPNTVTAIAPVTGNNAGVDLPTAEAPEGYTFVGWVAAQVADTETKPTTVYESGTTTAITQTTTLYALYSYSVGGESAAIVFEFDESTVNDAGKESTSAISSGSFASTDNTKKLVFDSLDKVYYANDKAGNKALKLGSSSASGTFTFSVPTDVAKVIFRVSGRTGKTGVTINKTNYEITTLAFSDSTACEYTTIEVDTPTDRKFEFSTYKPSSGDIRALLDSITYEIPAEGAVRFTTDLCTHTNTSTVTTVEPTCTEAGEKAEKCSNCGAILSTEEIEALDHNFVNDICTRCDAQQFTVTFVTPAGVTAIDAIHFIDGESVTLPTAGVPQNDHDYDFKGWATATYDNVTSKPTMYNPGEEFTATEDTTFYAVYEYTVAGGTSTNYVLKDLADITSSDSVVITMTNATATYALPNNGGAKAPVVFKVTPINGTLSDPDNTLKWNIGGTAGKYVFIPENDQTKNLYCTNNNNGVRIGTTAGTFTIESNYLYNNEQNRYLGIYNNQDWRSYTSINSNITNQTLAFYVMSTGTTYWTTEVEVILPPELDFYGASLEVGEGISFNYKAKGELFTNGGGIYSDPYAVFNLGGHETTVQGVYDSEDNVYVFQLKNIQPDWMGETVSADLFAYMDGELVQGESKDDYSVKAYCESQLAQNADNQTLRTLLVDILNYGAAAQKYTDPQVADDDLVNADLTEEQKAWGTSTTPELSDEPVFGTELTDPTAAFKGAALYLRETVRIRLRFSVDSIEDVTVTAQIGNGTPTELTDFTSAGNGSYYVFFDGLLATQMREPVTFTVLKDGTAISNTLVYSVEAYAASVNTSNTALTNMIYAMMNYGDAAYNYAN